MATKILNSQVRLARRMINNHGTTNSKESPCLLFTSRLFWKENRGAHTTIDIEEVDKHTKMVDEWWSLNGSMKALHSMNQIRVPLIRDGLVQEPRNKKTLNPLQGKKILDVGCGGGILSEPLARLGAEVTGIDASKELIELAEQHQNLDPQLRDNKLSYVYTTVEDHVTKHENHYDAVVASEIIEHVSDKELFVKACIQSLKPGGRIFFTTPNRTKLSHFAGILVAEYVLNLVPRGTHEYQKFITPTELSFLLERNNCQIQLIYGCFYSILTGQWSFIRSQTLLYALQAVKLK